MLNGKTAIITGCSRGIGKAAVDLFIKNNVSIIWACYRKKNESLEIEIKKQTAKLNIEFRPIYFDFTNCLNHPIPHPQSSIILQSFKNLPPFS